MWKKSKSLYLTTFLILSLSVFAPCFSSGASGSYTPPTEPQTTITMSLTQYNRLEEIIEAQDNRLTQLQEKLNLLKSNSTEASSELTASQNQLTKLKEELKITQESLENAKISLAQASETLKKQEASLQTLTERIKEMEHKQTVLRRQRDVWAAIAALSLGGVIARR